MYDVADARSAIFFTAVLTFGFEHIFCTFVCVFSLSLFAYFLCVFYVLIFRLSYFVRAIISFLFNSAQDLCVTTG